MRDNLRSMPDGDRATIARSPGATGGRNSLFSTAMQFIHRQGWMEGPADSLQSGVKQGAQAIGQDALDVLHGTWLEHPLHPVLTDVPIGAATAGIVLDAVGSSMQTQRLQGAADAAVTVAVVSAFPTAAAGLADWIHVQGRPRRTGFAHAILNLTSLLLNAVSLVFRFTGHRKAGVALSAAAYVATSGAGWLGGHLVFENGIGVDHSTFNPGPPDFTQVMPEPNLREGVLESTTVGGANVLLFRRGQEIWGIGDTCSHQGCLLSSGKLEGDTVRCPCHGSVYSLRDGSLIHGPSAYDQPRYEVRVWNGQIYVRQAPQDGQAGEAA